LLKSKIAKTNTLKKLSGILLPLIKET